MIVTPGLIEKVNGIWRDCELAKLQAYRARPDNPNRIEFASFGHARAARVPDLGWFNRVYDFGEEALDQLPDILRFYGETNTALELWISPEQTTEKVTRELVRCGFIPWGYLAKFYAALDELTVPSMDSAIEVARVDAAQMDEFIAVLMAGWGFPVENPPPAQSNIRLRLGIPGMHLFLARLEGRPIGAAVLYQQGDIAYLAEAATLPAERGKGCQLRLMAERIRLARELDVNLLVGGAYFGNSSFRNMQRIGLKIAFTDMAWHYPAAKK